MARLRIHKFSGTTTHIHPAHLEEGMFQVDAGGDRFKRGGWSVRRGTLRTTTPTQTGAVLTLIGVNVPGSGGALTLAVAGSDGSVSGFTAVTTQ